ncbi:MAG: hypothetical protein LBJ98_02420 [Endomicrobium sp.]|nr:hypothetical protein [Endomicrobium sp.]
MKRLYLAVMMCFSLGCINVVHADFLGIGRFWEDVKRETTNVLQPVEKKIREAFKNAEEANIFNRKKECMQRCIGGAWNNNVSERICADQCGWDLKKNKEL